MILKTSKTKYFNVQLSSLTFDEVKNMDIFFELEDRLELTTDFYLVAIDPEHDGEVFWEAATNPEKLDLGYDEEVDEAVKATMFNIMYLYLNNEDLIDAVDREDCRSDRYIISVIKSTPVQEIINQFQKFLDEIFN